MVICDDYDGKVLIARSTDPRTTLRTPVLCELVTIIRRLHENFTVTSRMIALAIVFVMAKKTDVTVRGGTACIYSKNASIGNIRKSGYSQEWIFAKVNGSSSYITSSIGQISYLCATRVAS